MQTRILVADDNAEIREILRILLTGEGYEVIEAKMETRSFNCLILPSI